MTWIGPKPEGAVAFFEKQVIVEQEAMPGTALKDLAEQAGVKIRYSCNKGRVASAMLWWMAPRFRRVQPSWRKAGTLASNTRTRARC